MLRRGWVIVALMLACITVSSTLAAETVNSPDPATMFLLQYKCAKAEPPYEAMARTTDAVRLANEFARPQAIERTQTTLKARTAALQDVKRITVRMSGRFSEYDSASGEYDLDLNDGSYIPFDAFGRQGRIALTNGTAAQAWKLPPHDAEEALRKNRGDRSVILVLTLELLDSPPAVDGEPAVLNTKIARYDVVTAVRNVRIGAMTVADAPR